MKKQPLPGLLFCCLLVYCFFGCSVASGILGLSYSLVTSETCSIFASRYLKIYFFYGQNI